MSNNMHDNENPNEHHSVREEIRQVIIDRTKAFWKWYTPNKEDAVAKKIIITILKTPVLLLVLLFSPVAALVLLFTFIAVF